MLERKAEAAFRETLGRDFLTIIGSVDYLRAMIASDPYKKFKGPADAKRIVTFLRGKPRAKLEPPVEMHGARVLVLKDCEVFSDCVRTPKGPVFTASVIVGAPVQGRRSEVK